MREQEWLILAHPTGGTFSSKNNDLGWLTRQNQATEIRRVPYGLANRIVAPPDLKSEAPDPAATGSSASNTYLGKGEGANTTTRSHRIAGTLRLRIGGAA